MTTEAEAVAEAVQQIQDRIATAKARRGEITEAIKATGYDVFVLSDAKARKKLDSLHAEGVTLEGEIAAMEGAKVEALRRQRAVARASAVAQDRENAIEQQNVLEEFKSAMCGLSEGLDVVVANSTLAFDLLYQMRQLDEEAPDPQLFIVNLNSIFRTALQKTPLRREFAPISPVDRKTAGEYLAAITPAIERRIAAIIGETDEQTEKAA